VGFYDLTNCDWKLETTNVQRYCHPSDKALERKVYSADLHSTPDAVLEVATEICRPGTEDGAMGWRNARVIFGNQLHIVQYRIGNKAGIILRLEEEDEAEGQRVGEATVHTRLEPGGRTSEAFLIPKNTFSTLIGTSQYCLTLTMFPFLIFFFMIPY
jgi:hypothetical protein